MEFLLRFEIFCLGVMAGIVLCAWFDFRKKRQNEKTDTNDWH